MVSRWWPRVSNRLDRAEPRSIARLHRAERQAFAQASAEDRERLWPLVNRNNMGLAPIMHPGARGRYDVYQRHTTRPIPVVILEPTAGDS